MKIDVKIKKVRESAVLPEYATSGSAALDLRHAGDEPITVKASSTIIPSMRTTVLVGI